MTKKMNDRSDPIRHFGSGISAHQQMMVLLIALMGIIYLIHIPVIKIFRSYQYYDPEVSSNYILDSVGDMGFSDSKCEVHNMVKGSQGPIYCRTGVITRLVAFGVRTDQEDQRYCLRKKKSECDLFLNDEVANSHFKAECLGKTNCTMPEIEKLLIPSTGH